MTDSLVLGGVIELLGGGVMSIHPQCYGAYFRLGTGFDLSAPQLSYEQVAGLLLDGSIVTGQQAANRTPTLPVVMYVPNSGDPEADRATLAGARELLLQTAAQDSWQLTWTRDGADPLIFDCMGLSSVVVSYSVRNEQALFSQVSVTFQAFPYGRSDVQEIIQFNSPAQQWPAPPAIVTIDDFGLTIGASNFLTGDSANFDGGTVGSWVTAGNCSIAQVSSPTQAGAGSLRLTSAAAGAMQAASQLATSYASMLPVIPGDTVTATGYYRAAVSGRSCNMGVDFYDTNGNVVGSTLRGSNITDTTSAFTQATAAVTAPSGSAWARANGQVLATGAANELHYLDTVVLQRGAVYSSNDSFQWGRQSISAFGSWSAYWARKNNDYPVYDHVMPAPLNITGLTKWGFWLGLATTAQQWQVWHRGTCHFVITLYDAAGDTLSFGFKRTCHASALTTAPHWQYMSADIPQVASGFDYTTISRYVISAWNWWKPIVNPDTGLFGQQVLQASAYFNLVQALPTSTGTPGTRGAWYTLPGIKGTARSPLGIQAAPGPSAFSSTALFTTTGSNNWTCPAGVTHVDRVEAWAAGGGGAGTGGSGTGGGGGGGGEYAAELNIPVTPTTVYHPFVGTGGAAGASGGNQGSNGGDSFFSGDSGRQTYAHGGRGGWHTNAWGGGHGGSGSSNYGHYTGGDGFQSNATGNDHGGGAGSSGGSTSNGHDSTGRSGASAPYGGGPGGDGGFANVNTSGLSRGFAPAKGPGGGGGGASDDGNGWAGAAGDNGQVLLTYGATGLLPLQSLIVHQPAHDAPDLFNPLCPVGNGSDTPNGATEYQIPDIGNLNARYDGTHTLYLVASAWHSPTVSRTVTIQVRQYPYSGGTATTLNIARTLVPSTDLAGTGLITDMGPLTLPLLDLPPGSTQGYFAVTITSTDTADRFLDVVIIDTAGTFVLVNIGSSSVVNNIWIDQPDPTRDLGRILGSNADRDQSFSILQQVERISGGPFVMTPDTNNRVFVYSAQGAPAVTAYYPPQWWTERLA